MIHPFASIRDRTVKKEWKGAAGALALLAGLAATSGAAAQDLLPIDPPCPVARDILDELDVDGDWPIEIYVDGSVAYLDGTITDALPCKIHCLAKAFPQVDALILEEIPGSMDDAANLRAAYLVREYGFDTHVMAYSAIDSGAVDLFLAGVERTGEPGAIFGVHSWSDGVDHGRDLPRDHPAHRSYLDYFAAMGIDPDFYWFTLNAAPFDGIHEMTPAELQRFGFFTRN